MSRLGAALSASPPLPLPFYSVRFKIKILLHVLLITTNLNLYNSLLPFSYAPPPPHPLSPFSQPFHSPSSLSKGNERVRNYFDPPPPEQTDPRQCETAGVSAEDELELSMPFSVIMVLLGSLKRGERDHW